jgi:hypothetical protein
MEGMEVLLGLTLFGSAQPLLTALSPNRTVSALQREGKTAIMKNKCVFSL